MVGTRGQVMSHTNPLPSRNKRFAARAAREILWASLAIVVFVVVAPVVAPAAELGAMNVHAKAYKHYNKVAYYDCRTGWWQVNSDGMRRPYWATRCG